MICHQHLVSFFEPLLEFQKMYITQNITTFIVQISRLIVHLKKKRAEEQISDYCFSTSLLERNRVQKALIRMSLGNFKWVEATDSDD